jgi:hypothetical protein
VLVWILTRKVIQKYLRNNFALFSAKIATKKHALYMDERSTIQLYRKDGINLNYCYYLQQAKACHLIWKIKKKMADFSYMKNPERSVILLG